ncbi:MAG: carboxypeptidase-like regulatory domain-containing protein [Polyangiaceae bacterium]
MRARLVLTVLATVCACKSSDPPKGDPPKETTTRRPEAGILLPDGGLLLPGLAGPVVVDPDTPGGIDKSADAGPSFVKTSERLLKLTNPDNLPTYSGPTGTIEGSVYVVGDAQGTLDAPFGTCDTPAARAMHGPIFRDERPAELKMSPTAKRPLLDAVVGVTDYGKFFIPVPKEPAVLTIKDCAYDRRTVVAMLGQQIHVRNEDTPAPHHYYGPQMAGLKTSTIRIVAPKTDPIVFFPEEPGRFAIVDTVDHRYMRVETFIAMNPLTSTTAALGKYRIPNVPVGKVKAHAMHPAFLNASKDKAEATVDVREGQTTTQDFVLTYKSK